MSSDGFRKVGGFKDPAAFESRLRELGLSMPFAHLIDVDPMSQPIDVGGFIVGNRWCVHPMEGWDGTTTGEPTEHTIRRWRHFGESGAKLIWGGEAFAVDGDGRANPNQLAIVDNDEPRAERGLRQLLAALLESHHRQWGASSDLLVGLQLTHSGRFSRPFDAKLRPRIVYHHPLLDAKFGIDPADDAVALSDDELEQLIARYVRAARIAQRAGFQFVDVKACHGYLGHELLSAFTRPGRFGGSFENRTRFMRDSIRAIQSECPGLMIGVRFSAFDQPPFRPDPARGAPGKLGPGVPVEYKDHVPYRYGFGCSVDDPMRIDLAEPIALVRMLLGLGVKLINISCGSPYYNPHIQRPAIFPPSDGYQPPEDPLIGVDRQIDVTRQIKLACPDALVVGSGFSYLQEYLPNVARAVVHDGWADFVGIGRMVLSYWDLPADALSGKPLTSNRICRTFSDCTTAPRNGIISGCYPLDPYYKDAPEHAMLKDRKAAIRKSLNVIQ